jgi:hypothetical protein
MIALVRSVMSGSTRSRSRFQVSASESTGTGTARLWKAASAVAMFVLALTSTSLPGSSSSAATARCRAVVPLVTATPCLAPTKSANSRSNAGMFSPNEPEISPARTASATAWTSSSPR